MAAGNIDSVKRRSCRSTDLRHSSDDDLAWIRRKKISRDPNPHHGNGRNPARKRKSEPKQDAGR